MPKEIVSKSEINSDAKLAIVKAFRITNKRAGEAKAKGPDGNDEYMKYCAHLRDLADKAEENGFHIWVNANGATGHTYEKDYRETPDEVNDFEAHKAAMEEFFAQQQLLMDGDHDASMPDAS